MNNHIHVKCLECGNTECYIRKNCLNISSDLVESMKFQSRFSSGQYIFRENSPVYGIFFVQTGKVKLFLGQAEHNKQRILNLVDKGKWLCFRGVESKTYSLSSMALEDSVLCFFETNDFLKITSTPVLTSHLLSFLNEELDKTERRMYYHSLMSVREKMAEALLYIKDSFGLNGEKELNVYLSREDIASIAGTSEELVIRMLSEFEKEGLIERKERGKKILICNEKKLMDMIVAYEED